VLLGSKAYSTPADIWSFGCIIYEILAQKPLFSGNCTIDQIEKVCSFTGYPSEEDIVSLESEVAHSLLKEMKISPNTKPALILKDFAPGFQDLLERMMVFNPAKRITVEGILEHELVKTFRKKEEETVCTKEVSTPINDNKKYTVEEYRRLIYGIKNVEGKPKGLSSSLGAGSQSPKYNSNMNKTAVSFGQNKMEHRPELQKRASFDRMRSGQQNYLDETSKKAAEKQSIRYIRSLNNLSKGENGFFQLSRKEQYNPPNREEVDSPCLPKQKVELRPAPPATQSPKFSMQQRHQIDFPKLSPSSTPVSVSSSLNSSLNNCTNSPTAQWKHKPGSSQGLLSSTELKEKVLQFRSTKNHGYKGSGLLPKTGLPFMHETLAKKGF
jgi:serine/threonine protein kinase